MVHLLGSVLFGILVHAQDTVVYTCSSVDKLVRHRVAVIVGILQFAAEQGAAMSASVARIWAAFWNADTSTVASIPVAMITDDMERSTAVSDGTTSERSDSHNNNTTTNNNNNDNSNNGGAAPLDVFTKARQKREKKRSSFNRTGRALKAQDKIHREASAPKHTASRTATKRPAVVTSAEPVLPAASSRSAVAPVNGAETTRYAWQSFETLRTGPGDWLTSMEVKQPDGSVEWVRVNLSKKK